MSNQVYVVRFSTNDASNVISVHSTRKQGLVAALQQVAEYVEYDWSYLDEEQFKDFARLCGIGDEDSLDNALSLWNDKLCRQHDAECPWRFYVSVEMLETDDVPLNMELPTAD